LTLTREELIKIIRDEWNRWEPGKALSERLADAIMERIHGMKKQRSQEACRAGTCDCKYDPSEPHTWGKK
jgi:hypothetical protein